MGLVLERVKTNVKYRLIGIFVETNYTGQSNPRSYDRGRLLWGVLASGVVAFASDSVDVGYIMLVSLTRHNGLSYIEIIKKELKCTK